MSRKPQEEELDLRMHVVRPDAAARTLAGRVERPTYLDPEPAHCSVPVSPLMSSPNADAERISEVLFGEPLRVYERRAGWAWVQSADDGYVGYVRLESLADDEFAFSHRIAVPLAHAYPDRDFKREPTRRLPLYARVRVLGTALSTRPRSPQIAMAQITGGGWVPLNHLTATHLPQGDIAGLALRFQGTPYLWGGRSYGGIDCSGLVQMCFRMAGVLLPRDTVHQRVAPATYPIHCTEISQLQPLDLLYIPGHVFLYLDGGDILHADGQAMVVHRQSLQEALHRRAVSSISTLQVRRCPGPNATRKTIPPP